MVMLLRQASAVTKAGFRALTDPRFLRILMQLQKDERMKRARKVHAESDRTRKIKLEECATAGPSGHSYPEVNVVRTFVGTQYDGLMTRAMDCFSISHQASHQNVTTARMIIAIHDAGIVRTIGGLAH